MSPQPSDYYIDAVTEAFLGSSHKFQGDWPVARDLLEPFIVRHFPVLRHYLPEIVGQCLALSWDDPQLGFKSQLHGFGLSMRAGNHPLDRESGLGNHRDDGSYLSLQAYDYFQDRGVA